MDAGERFLADVAARLHLPDDQRSEILEELAAHHSDAVADLVGRGREPDVADVEALRRLGSPDDLARALLRARRPRGQLLAAAGAGTWAAVRAGVFGALAGWGLVVLAAILVFMMMSALDRLFGPTAIDSRPTSGWTPAWNSVLTAGGLAFGAFFAGGAAVRAVSARAWRLPAEVRLSVAGVGMVAIGCVALVALEQSLNWASVIAFVLVPVAFGVGTRFEGARPPSVRLLLMTLIAALVLPVAGLALAGSPPGGGGYSWTSETHGYEMIAPWWQDPASAEAPDFPSSDWGWSAPGVETMNLEAASEAVIAGFRDVRLEAWRAESPGDGWQLIAGQRGPFATATARVDGTTISGTIRLNDAPGVDWAQVVMTAVGPDGRRYLLTTSGPEQTEFYGSVFAWFAATIR